MPAYRSCHLYTEHPRSLHIQARHLRSSPGKIRPRLLSVVDCPFSIPHRWFLFQSAPICSPDTVLSPLPFRSSVQYLTRWSKAPERGLVNALDRSLPMGQSLYSLSQGYSNALQTLEYRPSSFIKLSWAHLFFTNATNRI